MSHYVILVEVIILMETTTRGRQRNFRAAFTVSGSSYLKFKHPRMLQLSFHHHPLPIIHQFLCFIHLYSVITLSWSGSGVNPKISQDPWVRGSNTLWMGQMAYLCLLCCHIHQKVCHRNERMKQ